MATIIGLFGIAANAWIYQQKNRSGILIWKLISDLVWLTHYIVLGAYSGAAIAAIGVVRELTFFSDKKWSNSRWCLLAFMLISLCSAVLTWKSLYSLLPAAASIISVISFWKSRPKLSKILAFPISGCMLTYDVFARSYTGIANECITLVSAAIGLYLLCRKQTQLSDTDKR